MSLPEDILAEGNLVVGIFAELNLVALVLVGLVVVQRLAELVIAKRNTARLIATENAHEVGAGHYPAMVLMHTAWLLAVAYSAATATGIIWPLVIVFLILQAGRVWVLATLGRYWTTRIIVVPNAPLIRRGPFRFVRHPNYLVVTGELAVLPLAFGSWQVALVFTVLNAAMLWVRIGEESAANRAANRDPVTG